MGKAGTQDCRLGQYADLRRQLTRLAGARRHYLKARETAGEAATDRLRAAFLAELETTRRMADVTLAGE